LRRGFAKGAVKKRAVDDERVAALKRRVVAPSHMHSIAPQKAEVLDSLPQPELFKRTSNRR
jgi:hypothetical protein